MPRRCHEEGRSIRRGTEINVEIAMLVHQSAQQVDETSRKLGVELLCGEGADLGECFFDRRRRCIGPAMRERVEDVGKSDDPCV